MDNPTQAGFLEWVRGVMGIPQSALPDDSVFVGYAFDIAVQIVSLDLGVVSPLIYKLAVYNLGGDLLINYAQDIPPSTYFFDVRKNFGVFNFAPGVVTSSSDGGTSSSYMNPDFMKEFTMANLQNLKTPYGRQYLAFAQSLGPLWGLT
jgi:hypothetical protein